MYIASEQIVKFAKKKKAKENFDLSCKGKKTHTHQTPKTYTYQLKIRNKLKV